MSPSAKIIDGRALAEKIQEEVREQIRKLNLRPGLAVVLVGNDPGSELYVKLKAKAAQKCGILFCLYQFKADCAPAEILDTIAWLNQDEEIDGILVQLPLPPNFAENEIIRVVDPDKDADGFHPDNVKKLLGNEQTRITPGLNLGIIQLLTSSGAPLQGRKAVIIARSEEFTQTLAHTLQDFDVDSTIVNPDSVDANSALPQADIIITAAGKPNWLKADHIKKGAIVIDVGTSRLDRKTLVGDADFKEVSEKAGWITPVPGGVGPMTVAMLLKNTTALAIIHRRDEKNY